MSLIGKIGLLTSGINIIAMVLATWIMGGWFFLLYLCLGLFIIGLFASLFFDRHLYLHFLSLRTTKNGLSMGVICFIALVLCVALAYLSVHFEKTIDITEEGINSLAPQSLSLLEGLEEDMTIRVFYKGKQGNQQKNIINRSLILYKQNSSYIKDRYHDVYLNNKLAQNYLNDLSSRRNENIFVFVEYKGKKVSVDMPFDEEKMTSAMINVTRLETKSIYVLSGHGERDLDNSQGEGLSAFRESLERSSFEAKTWNFVEKGSAVPSDAAALVVAGPERPFLEREMEWLDEYLVKGGRLLLALDPDKKHNLAEWLKKYGLVYKGYYVLDQVARLMGLGRTSPLGIQFDPQHKITDSFPTGTFVLFNMASDLEASESVPSGFSVTELVRTNPGALSVPGLDQMKSGKQASHVMALLLAKQTVESENNTGNPASSHEASNSHEDKSSSENKENNMMVALFGDSDFMSNNFLSAGGMNRDLVMNTLSYLVDESDLVSIRPKRLKATALTLKYSDKIGIIIFSIICPIIFLTSAFVLWFRRRSS